MQQPNIWKWMSLALSLILVFILGGGGQPAAAQDGEAKVVERREAQMTKVGDADYSQMLKEATRGNKPFDISRPYTDGSQAQWVLRFRNNSSRVLSLASVVFVTEQGAYSLAEPVKERPAINGWGVAFFEAGYANVPNPPYNQKPRFDEKPSMYQNGAGYWLMEHQWNPGHDTNLVLKIVDIQTNESWFETVKIGPVATKTPDTEATKNIATLNALPSRTPAP